MFKRKPPEVVTPENWKEVSDQIHRKCMEMMEIPLKSPMEQYFLGMALAGEVGEFCNLLKKRWRDGYVDPKKLRDELADIRAYLRHLETSLGVEDEQYVADKTNEVLGRNYAR